ncbi:MAG TPA: Stf0 family sulfotransferase [Nevskiaceae bacterium]|nr:Stf0 family sulfotransferase [Nevskiaceae bacterium]
MNDSSRQRREAVRQLFAEAGVTQCNFLCASFRSGSTYIASLLGNNGVRGLGYERLNFFVRDKIPHASDEKIIAAWERVIKESSADGVFTAKLMWGQWSAALRSLNFPLQVTIDELREVFPSPRFVYNKRLDVFSQAVSYWKAQTLNVWHDTGNSDEPEPELPYEFGPIAKCLRDQLISARMWELWLAPIPHETVVYEEFIKDPATHLQRMCTIYGLERGGELKLETKHRKQSNSHSKLIRAKFIEDIYQGRRL